MSHYTRRRFLAQSARGLLGAGLAWGGVTAGRARAQGLGLCGVWGSLPDPTVGGQPVGAYAQWACGNHPGFKILELWLHGGASPWESFWIPDAAGAPDIAAMGLDTILLGNVEWSGGATVEDPCSGPGHPGPGIDTIAFGVAADSRTVYWGPPSKPLWNRPDILARTRMVTLGHGLAPHPAARPYGLAGLTLGNPRRAGTGASVQRRHLELNPGSALPVSFILHKQRRSTATAAAATGQHPGSSRPLVVEFGTEADFEAQLDRPEVSQSSDWLFNALRHDYADRMHWPNSPLAVRSSGFESYRVASELLFGAESLQAIFSGGVLALDTSTAKCPRLVGISPELPKHHIKSELGAAAYLLSQNLARHVCVIDSGLDWGYDVHNETFRSTASILNFSRWLAALIKEPTLNPGGPIDLNDTLILINSEFGRTPQVNNNMGRDHWPQGYVSILIGGPITPTTRGIRGTLTNDGYPGAGHEYTPTDIRGAVLLAAGIDPFAQGGFRVDEFSGDLRDQAFTEVDVRHRLVECIFGA